MSLTFVLPAFNEVENIGRSIERCVEVGAQLGIAFEVIAVDDGSSDGTCRVVETWVARDPRVKAIHHPHNCGYGAALRSGLLAARMDRVFFTDADLQFDLAEVSRLLEHASRCGVVAGYRAPRRDPAMRRAMGWGWSRLVGALFGLPVRDVDCAFKVFDRRIFEQIELQSIGALVNTELLVRARALGFTVCEVPVSHFPRAHGVQSGASPRVVFRALRELAVLHAELRHLSRVSPQPSEGR